MIELTNEQLDIAMRYVGRKMMEDKVSMSNTGEVVKWMILNPLPTLEKFEAETEIEDEKEKQRRIQFLTEELKKLEGN